MFFQSLVVAASLLSTAVSGFPKIVKTGNVPTGLCDTVKSEAGYYHTEEDKKYFYWFFESRNDPANDPVFVWMTGGPGCSSQVALFHENGPCRINDDHKTTRILPSAWNTNASVIYIDQPAGVGFSTGVKDDHTEKDIGDNMYLFLQEFFANNPKYAKNDFYVVGESYGGHYVPNVAGTINKYNKQGIDGTIKINLVGIGIGNGLTDPAKQYDQYCRYSLNNGYRELTTKENAWVTMKVLWPGCESAIQKCSETDPNDPGACTEALRLCSILYSRCASGLTSGNYNMYNVQEKCKVPPLCYDFSDVQDFVDQEHVRAALGVGDIKWESCNMGVHENFNGDFMRNYAPVVRDLLEDGIRVLVYAGDADFICNWMGNEAWTRKLEWKHTIEFSSAELKKWKGDGQEVKGELRQAKNLSFFRMYGAGHMTPLDKPEVSNLMINQFFTNTLRYDEEEEQ